MERQFRNSKRYMANWNALYAGTPVEAKAEAKPRKVNPTPKERTEQAKFVRWLKDNHLVFFAVPNGQHKSLRTRMMFQAQGLIAGVPDVFICHPHPHPSGLLKTPHGLFVELKRRQGGVVSLQQRRFMEKLTQNGYHCVVAYGADEAIQYTREYLRIPA